MDVAQGVGFLASLVPWGWIVKSWLQGNWPRSRRGPGVIDEAVERDRSSTAAGDQGAERIDAAFDVRIGAAIRPKGCL